MLRSLHTELRNLAKSTLEHLVKRLEAWILNSFNKFFWNMFFYFLLTYHEISKFIVIKEKELGKMMNSGTFVRNKIFEFWPSPSPLLSSWAYPEFLLEEGSKNDENCLNLVKSGQNLNFSKIQGGGTFKGEPPCTSSCVRPCSSLVERFSRNLCSA